jgi:hypothetical protein
MSDRSFAILDPVAGISGDMLLGALVAAGASADWLAGLPERLGLHDLKVKCDVVTRCGVMATKVSVVLPGGTAEGPEGGAHHHHHHHEPHTPHRRVGELLEVIAGAPLSPWVKEKASLAFRLLAGAEARVHGSSPDDVRLHEVGALDALIDIVAGVEGFERLGIQDVYALPVALGDGWIRSAHGMLPVPAPATAFLVEGLTVRANGPVHGEATTPTGAALLRALSLGAPPVRWRAVAAGWGAGARDPEAYPNALRLTIAVSSAEAAEVTVVGADLDDLSPEYLEPLREALVAAGALDVQTWPTFGKKGRIGFRVEAVAPAGQEDQVARAFFSHSTTAGVRWFRAERNTLARREVTVTDPLGIPVRVKVLDAPTGPRAKPEYDDVVRAARDTGRPALEVARALRENKELP